jgi:dienelactone hydrolase
MDPLDTWTHATHTADDITRPTYRKGTGPGVVLIHELPGMTPEVIAFADEVAGEFEGKGHSVLTEHRQQEAVDRVLAFFCERLS